MTWDDVLARTDLVGGEIETQEDGYVFRGPISSIERKGDMVNFTCTWCARLSSNGWENWENVHFSINVKYATPSDISDGRIFYTAPFLGAVTIFPKNGSKLDPARVKGLQISA